MHRVQLILLLAVSGCGDGRALAPPLPDDMSTTPPDLGQPPPPLPDLAIDAAIPILSVDLGDADGGAPSIGTATITGSMNGFDVPTVKSVAAVVTGQSFNVYIADRADLCTIMQMGSSPENTSIFQIGSTAGSAPHTFPAGMYTFPAGDGSGAGGGGMNGGGGGGNGNGNGMGTPTAIIERSASNCIFDGYDQAALGGFTITAPVPPDATEIDGDFDITFEVGAQSAEFKGSFRAPVCPNAKDIPETPIYCE